MQAGIAGETNDPNQPDGLSENAEMKNPWLLVALLTLTSSIVFANEK
jgi:hypothetical protein